jgi:hypothetical protein
LDPGGPREWIKTHGCNFASTPEKAFTDIIGLTPLGLFTKEGQTFITDMNKNHANWGEGMKEVMGNPVMISMVASMAVVYGLTATKAGAAVMSAVVPTVAETMGAGGLAGGAATAGVGLLVMGVAIGIAIGVMTMDSNEDQNRGPPDPSHGPYASEYTVGGWKDNIGTSPPLTLGFNDGWVTKPLEISQDERLAPDAFTVETRSGSRVPQSQRVSRVSTETILCELEP